MTTKISAAPPISTHETSALSAAAGPAGASTDAAPAFNDGDISIAPETAQAAKSPADILAGAEDALAKGLEAGRDDVLETCWLRPQPERAAVAAVDDGLGGARDPDAHGFDFVFVNTRRERSA